VTLNHVQFVEAARVLATHALQAETTLAARFEYLALRVLARPPSAPEVTLLSSLLEAELQQYEADPAAAAQLVLVGESIAPAELAPAELAAWTLVASTLLNLDEALSK
jgi:hypothetical protein